MTDTFKCFSCKKAKVDKIRVTDAYKLGGEKEVCTYCYHKWLKLFSGKEEMIQEWREVLGGISKPEAKRLIKHIQGGGDLLIGPKFILHHAVFQGVPSIPVVIAKGASTRTRKDLTASEEEAETRLVNRENGDHTLYNYLTRCSLPSHILDALGAKEEEPALIDPFV